MFPFCWCTAADGKPAIGSPTSRRLFRPLAEAGLAWFSIDYRLTPDGTHAEQLQDLRDAIAFLRQRAGSFNIDAASW